jgi:hypothetical protein
MDQTLAEAQPDEHDRQEPHRRAALEEDFDGD